MKKAGLILLMVACATVLTIGSTFAAGVIDTPHDVTSIAALTAQGACSVCHIPHKSTGDRLWSATQSSVGAYFDQRGDVGVLCSSCHVTDGAYKANLTQASWAEKYVYAPMSHDVVIDPYVMTDTQDDVSLSGLPYATKDDPIDKGDPNTIQCTSCHNVHDNATNKPFLRVNIRDLCIRCHYDRAHDGTDWQNGATAGIIDDWGGGLGRFNLGSHPVGTNITGDMPGTRVTPIIVFDDLAPTAWIQFFNDDAGITDRTDDSEYPAGGGWWNLGRHTATDADVLPGTGKDGGVVCVTCHAIHGVQDDTDPTEDKIAIDLVLPPINEWDYNPNVNLLALPQSSGMSPPGSPVIANGGFMGDDLLDGANRLCEACHRGGIAGPDPFSLELNDESGPYQGDFFPNPGGTDYTHPIDDVVVLTEAVSEFPDYWPDGGAGDPTPPPEPTPIPICESCHIAHPARSIITVRGDITPGVLINDPPTDGAGQFILRNGAFAVCAECHTTGIGDHHPVGTMTNDFPLVIDVPWDTLQIGKDGFIGNSDEHIECGDCHNMPGAHGWPGPNQINLDPDWWPLNNGRDPLDTMLGELANSMGASATCELCHYKMQQGPWIAGIDPATTPTNDSATDWDKSDYPPAGEYQKIGEGTHFLGEVNAGAGAEIIWSDGWMGPDPGTLFDARYERWPNSNPSGATGWSRWGTTTEGVHLVCESCHELEPDKNEPGSKLLLFWFAEDYDDPINQGKNAKTSYFCEGCHSENGPDGTHAMSEDIVSRTNLPLDIDNTNTFKLLRTNAAGIGTGTPDITPPGAPGYSTFPSGGADLMNCDSCHQVHDANTDSRTYILDAPDPNVTAGPDTDDYERGGPPHVDPYKAGFAHPLGNTDLADGPPDLNYTGFCDQCHWYTWDTRPQ